MYKFHKEGLRLVQVERGQMKKLPPLMEHLSAIKSKKFILFFDDLSFDEDEKEYKYLKSVIDGGIIPQPDNVVIYATSNRRHLLKETWRDRRDDLDEVYRDDSQNESISLSDRFGLIIHYAAPTQDEYLQIIDHELRKAGVVLELTSCASWDCAGKWNIQAATAASPASLSAGTLEIKHEINVLLNKCNV